MSLSPGKRNKMLCVLVLRTFSTLNEEHQYSSNWHWQSRAFTFVLPKTNIWNLCLEKPIDLLKAAGIVMWYIVITFPYILWRYLVAVKKDCCYLTVVDYTSVLCSKSVNVWNTNQMSLEVYPQLISGLTKRQACHWRFDPFAKLDIICIDHQLVARQSLQPEAAVNMHLC